MQIPEKFQNEDGTLNVDALVKSYTELEKKISEASIKQSALEKAMFFKDVILPVMDELRVLTDELELIVPRSLWEVPTCGDLLFSVR